MERIKLLLLSFLLVIGTAACKQEQDKHHDDDLHEITHGDHKDHHDDKDHCKHHNDKDKKHKKHKKHHKHDQSVSQLKAELLEGGYQIFDYVDEETGDTVVMQQYYIAFLNRGPNRTDSKVTADSLQALHMEHLGRMYEEGYADISGPFGDDGDMRGITIYNVPTLQMADSLANMDPMVQAGWLQIEVKPWWAAKGFPLR